MGTFQDCISKHPMKIKVRSWKVPVVSFPRAEHAYTRGKKVIETHRSLSQTLTPGMDTCEVAGE